MTQLIDYEKMKEHIGLITLNRPEAANAMSKTLLEALRDTVHEIDNDPTVYCVIITGAGEKAFCAGADLKERKGMSEAQVIETVKFIGETVTLIEHMKVPVIAAINGAAFGGGLELALACDIRIAAKSAKMGLTETSLAIIPGAGGTQRLPRLIGPGQAKKLIYTASPVNAEEALSLGLVEGIAENEPVLETALQMAEKIAGNGPIALKQAKTAINNGMQMDVSTALNLEHLAYRETIPTRDRLEGLQAFREKRKPVYTGE
ncbi:enoyl-CoA hydratase [Virgibacillus sp. YIM 98842]|jgi:enoyl-CoA hydratase/carnithine racemase|uniref:enoyl-CoA hydratase n=1 Tax=Virgibacillus sp. YIM 98842 TaxID=2663533 RepID=UPI0013D996CF|nr:enoyl-CoA hydratase [Virgibacillus sp. YIM 98842]